jgi:SAM-dependent methyltransferase
VRAYEEKADLYISLFGTIDSVHTDDLARAERHLSSGVVLDAGCGPGHWTAHLSSLGADATGIDVTPSFIAHARAAHPGVPFRVGSLTALDVASGSVDGVLAWYSLIHFVPAEIDGVLAELRRVLVPGGRLVLGFFDGGAVEAFEHGVTTAYRWPVEEMSSRLGVAGFVEVERGRREAGDGQPRSHAVIVAEAAG